MVCTEFFIPVPYVGIFSWCGIFIFLFKYRKAVIRQFLTFYYIARNC